MLFSSLRLLLAKDFMSFQSGILPFLLRRTLGHSFNISSPGAPIPRKESVSGLGLVDALPVNLRGTWNTRFLIEWLVLEVFRESAHVELFAGGVFTTGTTEREKVGFCELESQSETVQGFFSHRFLGGPSCGCF